MKVEITDDEFILITAETLIEALAFENIEKQENGELTRRIVFDGCVLFNARNKESKG